MNTKKGKPKQQSSSKCPTTNSQKTKDNDPKKPKDYHDTHNHTYDGYCILWENK